METRARMRRVVAIILVFAAYITTAKLGLRVAFVQASATAVWAPTGIAISALLLLGYSAWPVIFLAALIVNATTAGSLLTSLGIAAGNTLEAICAAYLLARYANGRHAFARARDVFVATPLAGVVSPAVSATIGVAVLSLAGYAPWARFGTIWSTWWVGDATGALVIAPAILLWSAGGASAVRRRPLEIVALAVALVGIGLVVFGGAPLLHGRTLAIDFLCMPILVWAAYRFGSRMASASVIVLSGIALVGTLNGTGPFAMLGANSGLLVVQGFMGIASITSLALAAVVTERRAAEDRLRQLAVTDPLTGLANYRHLVRVLSAEIERVGRTARPFAVLFLDLDELKRVNDRYGHLTGSRALIRLANAIRASCRTVDVPARYGGDEFAVILPESDERAAQHVAQRIAARLVSDGEHPRVTVSIGVAIYPRDGVFAEALIDRADHALYGAKGRRIGH